MLISVRRLAPRAMSTPATFAHASSRSRPKRMNGAASRIGSSDGMPRRCKVASPDAGVT
jgi:hypothetical protein